LQAVSKHAPAGADLSTVGDLPGAIKPHISAINAVLSGLPKHSKATSKIQESVLNWASELGLKPDAVTYTILVQLALRRRDTRLVFRHLEEMAASRLEPKPELFSVILNELFRHSSVRPLPLVDSKQRVMDILARIEQFGWHKNDHILQIIVDCLLKQHNNYDAAMAVIDYMAEHGIEPSEHMYTSFVTYYFTRDPPDIEAVNRTVHRITALSTRDVGSTFLYDRLIEGYAKCGEVRRVNNILRRMSVQERRNSWTALGEALDAFVRAEKYEFVQELVADLEKRRLLQWEKLELPRGTRKPSPEVTFLNGIRELRAKGLLGGHGEQNTDIDTSDS
jgi:hypothetical protein